MQGLLWTAGVIGIALLIARQFGYFRPLKRTQVVIIVLTLGIHSIVIRTADEILREPVALETALRGVFAGIAALMIFPPLVRKLTSQRGRRFRGMAVLTAYVGIAIISVAYSVAIVSTAAKAFELAVGFALVWLLMLDGRKALEEALFFIIFVESSLLLAALIGFFALPGTFAVRASRPGFLIPLTLTSPYAHSNGLAAAGGLVSAFAVARFLSSPSQRNRRAFAALATAATVAIIMASGRQGVVIWLASIGILLWLYRRNLFVLFIGPAAVSLVAMNWQAVVQAFTRGGRVQQTLALTGRIGWWSSAIEAWTEHPVTGFGFGVGGRFVALVRLNNLQTPGVHGGYVEALVGLGLLGAVPLIYCMWRVGSWCAKSLLLRLDPAVPIVAVPLFLHTAISRGFGGWLNSDFLIFAILLALADVAPIPRPSPPYRMHKQSRSHQPSRTQRRILNERDSGHIT